MKTNLLVLTLFSLASCGYDRGEVTPAETDIGKVVKAESIIQDGELATAQRICYALRSMRTKFRSDFLNHIFHFQVSNRKCDASVNTQTDYTVETRLVVPFQQGPMIYDSASSDFYYSEVQTNQEGHLTTICEDILAGRATTDTVQQTQRLKKQITFDNASGTAFKVNYAAERPSPEGPQFIVYKSEVYTVKTATNSGDHLGLVEKIDMAEECAEGSAYPQSSFTQKFLTRTER
jgi:hypothetical protein